MTTPLTHDVVAEIAGELDDVRIAEIIATGATLEELEQAIAWASGSNRPARDLDRPLSGRIAQLYDILTTDLGFEEEAEEAAPEEGKTA